MPRSLILLIYNIALPLFFVLAFPAWLVKMWRRGGYGTGLLERFAVFKTTSISEPKDTIYIHAVSVGEVLIALKLIKSILDYDASLHIVLAATTSTGHAVARQNAPSQARAIYSPLDFNFIVRMVMRRFSPQQIVLIEAEAWPNLLRIAQKKNIPVSIVNARLSARSEARFKKFSCLVTPVFSMITRVGVQDTIDKNRFAELGIPTAKIHITGSIKFDLTGGQAPQKRSDFQKLLNDFGNDGGNGRKVLLLASTHTGEEKIIAEAVKKSAADIILLIVPRHAERRTEVVADLRSVGYLPVLKTNYEPPENAEQSCLIADTTGELRDWTAHADWVIIGKSWLNVGGQNPAEAIAAQIPVICGPHMENFQPLVQQLCNQKAIMMLDDAHALTSTLDKLENKEINTSSMTIRAHEVLSQHNHALKKTLELLEVNASVRNP